MASQNTVSWGALASAMLLLPLLGGCEEYQEPAHPRTPHYDLVRYKTAPVTGAYHTPFQNIDDGFAAAANWYRARVRYDAAMFMYEPAAEGQLGSRSTISFKTVAISRGDESCVALEGAPRLEHGAVIVPRGCGVEEVFKTAAKGVEQSWRLAHAPAGDGDLIVRVRVGGGAAVSQTAEGIKFEHDDGQLGILYEHPHWIDSKKRKHHHMKIQAQYQGDEIVLRVPERVLEHSKFPAVLDGS